MSASAQIPVFLVILPFFAALAITVIGLINRRLCYPIAVVALGGAFAESISLLNLVFEQGVIHYRLGGWPPPFGIEYVIDHLNAVVLAVITFVALLSAIFSRESVKKELPEKIPHYYTLFMLLVTGLLGMTITGDAFNLYVLIEISALTAYALIAVGKGRAMLSSFNYVIMGTVGACFYLLGVGHLYIMTGSLNMTDLASLPSEGRTILPAAAISSN